MQKKKVIIISSSLAMLALVLVASPTLAATIKNSPSGKSIAGRVSGLRPFMPQGGKGITSVKPAATGKITAISGNTLTISGNDSKAYTVDATSAKISSGFGQGASTITFASLTVGEMISVTGTVNGASVAATAISVFNDKGDANRPAFNGVKPAAMGKISAVSGSIITVTGNDKTAYTVDATAAVITKGFGANAQTVALSTLTSGEMISITGTVNGTNIAATAITVFDNSGKGKIAQPGDAARTPHVMGKVTAVNGSSFTVLENGRARGPQATTTPAASFTVNSNSATVFTKDNKTATIADVSSGVTVVVSGTIDSTAKTVSAASVNIMTKQSISSQPGKVHVAPTAKNKTSIIGKIMNLFNGKKK